MDTKKNRMLHETLHETLHEENVLQNNEIQANKLVGFTMFLGSAVLATVWVLSSIGIFHVPDREIKRVILQGMLELLIPALLCRLTKARPKWLKYVLLIELLVVMARTDAILGFNVVLVMVIPVILSCRYFSRRFTICISVLTAVLFALAAFANAYWNVGYLDLNFYDPPKGTVLIMENTLKNAVEAVGVDRMVRTEQVMILSFLPKLMIFLVIAVVCVKIAGKGRNMVLEQEQITKKNARVESELELANNIQTHMLPTIFPPFPNREEIELYAIMDPAKEIGGDFYDFFMIDDRNLALVIADVSGKGIPAALFMVIAKTLIKNEVSMGEEPAEAFSKVNQMLCEGNDENMFVTAWLGILDTETGKLSYVNAGHNPPLLRQNGGEFEYLKSRPGFVLAGMEGIHYKQYETMLKPGDEIFLYTDGVTEAENEEKAFYGADRLKRYLNQHAGEHVRELLHGLRKDIGEFAGAEEQFDDITMLAMYYREKRKDEQYQERKFPARSNQLQEVITFIEQELTGLKCPEKLVNKIEICAEEIFVNISKYAYMEREEDVTVGMKCEDGELTLKFTDHGIPFNPLVKKDPDITKPAEEREIGGLGIFIVKKTMDDVQYEYQNGMNILTMKKKITE